MPSDASSVANEVVEQVGQAVGGRAQASAVFGEPVEREGVTVIPVAKARFGFGGGGGSGSRHGDEGGGGGGGGGASITPVGYIEVRESRAEFRRITTATDLLALALAGSIAALTLRRLLGS
jgi:uncharacterized spore protein YtfJ